jgi:hypothetical protein
MSGTDSANAAHRATVNNSEMLRQADEAAALKVYAGQGGSGPFATLTAAMRTASVNHYRRCLPSALANGVTPVPFVVALYDLNLGGH